MSLWILPDSGRGLLAGTWILFVADSRLPGKIFPVCQVNSGVNEEKHQHLSACSGYETICHCSHTHLFFFVLVVCPSFGFGFNKQFLESLNNTEDDFKKGNWIGNYSLDPLDSEVEMIYRNATLDVEKGMGFLI